MSNIDKLKSAAAKAVDNFDPNMFVEIRDVLALLDELEAKDRQIAELKLAIRLANDRYENRTPTQWAYDQACLAIEKHRTRADGAEKRIAELTDDCWIYEGTVKKLLERAEAAESACSEAARILESGERMALTRSVEILRAAAAGKGAK